MKLKKINIKWLETELWIGVAETEDDFVKARKKFGDPDEDPCDGLYIQSDDTHAVLFMKDVLTSALIVHEIFHAACGILEKAGQEYDPENNEVFARMCEFLYKETCSLLNITKV